MLQFNHYNDPVHIAEALDVKQHVLGLELQNNLQADIF